MTTLVELLTTYGVVVVFLGVLADEGGLPVPSFAVLLVAGSAVVAGRMSLWTVLFTALAAAMLADIAWFTAGRYYGRQALSLLCRISFSPDTCVRRTEAAYMRFGSWSLVFVRFVPGLTNLTVALSGNSRSNLAAFLLLDFFGCLFYFGLMIVLGMVFHDAIGDIIETLRALGLIGGTLVVIAIAAFIGLRFLDRIAFTRQLRTQRISAQELARLLASDPAPLVLDVRSAEDRARDGMIPGALPAHPKDIGPALLSFSRETEIVVYCACPNEASAAVAATHLRRAGFRKIRLLSDGVDGWLKAGYQLATA